MPNPDLPEKGAPLSDRAKTPGTKTPGAKPHEQPRASRAAWETELFVLEGRDRRQLAERVGRFIDQLSRHADADLKDVAFTLNTSLSEGGCRLALVAGSVDDLSARLKRAAERLADPGCQKIKDIGGIYFFEQPLAPEGKIGLLFAGEGAQYLGMVGDLVEHFPEVRDCFDECDAMAVKGGHDVQLSNFLLPPQNMSQAERETAETQLRQIGNAMYSVLMADWALGRLLVDGLGLEPAAYAGHSAGELAALMYSGGLGDIDSRVLRNTMQTLQDQEEADDEGGAILLAVGASRAAAEGLLAEVQSAEKNGDGPLAAFVAMDNCPHQTVIVGDIADMQRVEKHVAEAGWMYERLSLGRGYHTRLFDPFMGPLCDMFADLEFRAPDHPVYSCTTGKRFPDDGEEIYRLAMKHWVSPVEFTKLIHAMYDDGVRLFVESGPRGNLTAFVEDTLRGKPFLAVPADLQRRCGVTQLNHLAAQLTSHHVPLRLAHLYERRNPQHLDWLFDEGQADAKPAQRAQAPPLNKKVAVPAPTANPGLVAAGKPSANRLNGHSRTAQPRVLMAANETPPTAASGDALPEVRAGDERSAVMDRYWQVMGEFLEVQQDVMQQYLGGNGGGSGHVPAPVSAAFVAEPLPPADQFPDDEQTHPDVPYVDPAERPLVGEIVEHEAGRKLVMRRVQKLDEDLYADQHTVGGRSISRVDPSQHGLPIAPMTFTLEMMAEVASLLVPGTVVIEVREVSLMRWLAFYDDPITIEATAKIVETPKAQQDTEAVAWVEVQVRDLGSESAPGNWAAAVGTVRLAERFAEAPLAEEFVLEDEQLCPIPIKTLYNNLFHGPLFQGVKALEKMGNGTIVSRVEVPPRSAVFGSQSAPDLMLDPVLLDIIMHPMAGWHLAQPDQTGRILLPFGIESVRFFGPPPPVGSQLEVRGQIEKATPRQFGHGIECLDPQGRVWCRMCGSKYWRFYLPFTDVNFHGPKDIYFLSTDWPETLPQLDDALRAEQAESERPVAWCMRLDPPDDLNETSMQEVAARITQSAAELERFHALTGDGRRRMQWLFGHIAAKDAMRVLLRKHHGERLFTADIEIDYDEAGRPVASPRDAERPADYPAISIAHTDGLIAAIAAYAPHPGIDVECVEPRDDAFLKVAFTAPERELMAEFDDQDEAATRFWCAKEAVAKGLGRGLTQGPRSLVVTDACQQTGAVRVRLAAEFAEEFPELATEDLVVRTVRDGDHMIATTLCETE